MAKALIAAEDRIFGELFGGLFGGPFGELSIGTVQWLRRRKSSATSAPGEWRWVRCLEYCWDPGIHSWEDARRENSLSNDASLSGTKFSIWRSGISSCRAISFRSLAGRETSLFHGALMSGEAFVFGEVELVEQGVIVGREVFAFARVGWGRC